MTAEIREYVDKCLTNGRPFAVFRFPGEDSFHVAGRDGYELYVNRFNTSSASLVGFSDLKSKTDESAYVPVSTARDAYLQAAEGIITSLRNSSDSKTVLSRIIAGEVPVEGLTEKALQFFASNARAFCLLMQDADRCLYIMASPEVLLKISDGKMTTLALAGTRPRSAENLAWDEKNISEQSIVAQYIGEKLAELGFEAPRTETFTLESNNVEHIATVFECPLRRLRPTRGNAVDMAKEVLDALSPTPAVCGWPVEHALSQIARYETEPRGFYGGYTLVTNNHDNEIKAYVNLRCARIDLLSGRYVIQTGSGLTAQSDALREWEETDLKARPLYEILENKPSDNHIIR